MDDIISKYKKQQRIKNITIVLTSLFLALGINLFLFNTDIWRHLNSSILNYSQNNNVSDLYLEKFKNNIILLKSSKDMNNVKSLSFSINYNPENIVIKDKLLEIDDAEIMNVVDTDWINTLIINFNYPVNIKKSENIVKIVLEKKQNQPENINLSFSNFIDFEDNKYILSTSWVQF